MNEVMACKILGDTGGKPLCFPKSLPGGTSPSRLYGEVALEWGNFFRLELYKRVGIS